MKVLHEPTLTELATKITESLRVSDRTIVVNEFGATGTTFAAASEDDIEALAELLDSEWTLLPYFNEDGLMWLAVGRTVEAAWAVNVTALGALYRNVSAPVREALVTAVEDFRQTILESEPDADLPVFVPPILQ